MTQVPEVEIVLDAVILAVDGKFPRVLTTSVYDKPALPSGLLKKQDRTIEEGLRRWVREQTSLELGYVEQLYTFGDSDRVLETDNGSKRLLSITYLALVEPNRPSAGANWIQMYDLLPWEDTRNPEFRNLVTNIRQELTGFVNIEDSEIRNTREERVQIMFPSDLDKYDGVRSLDRYELLFEADLLSESGGSNLVHSQSMHLDHRRIVATALSRVRGKLTYRPVVFELLPDSFTLLQLQKVVEALLGKRLHKQNFRRLVDNAGLVQGTGQMSSSKGRPAELFEFRREVLLERPRPGFRS